ncbi:unnamed protein product [Ilex paraguariensis]|uniref:VLRF1 domain-containing protein n=1 Tax=Ilex paraguariensis TaxID=185542 RepID=A0ABC8UZI1_9AQUA
MAGEREIQPSTATDHHRRQPQLQQKQEEKRHRSIFDLPSDFFDSCRLLHSPSSISIIEPFDNLPVKTLVEDEDEQSSSITKNNNVNSMQRWSCNTCKAEFDSLQDQRSHFKSDIHRFNIKLTIAGKDTVKEEDFDELTSDSLCKDYDISSISGSEEDDDDKESSLRNDLHRVLGERVRNKIFVHLRTGERLSVWKCLVLDESEYISLENDRSVAVDDGGYKPSLTEREVTEKLKYLIHEPRDNTRLRIVLLARGGHFAGCVFDGNSVVAHKTFHRYVVRAKAGKKQSSKDGSGKIAHSAGAALRRYNELALKKDIQELLAAWKLYFDASSCIFIYAPSNNRQLFFDGERPYVSCQHHAVRHVPLTVRRPTFKEARRIYNLLTQVSYEIDEETTPNIEGESVLSASTVNNGCPGRPTFKEARRIYNLLTQVSYEIDEETTPNIEGESLLSASTVNNGCPGSSKEDLMDNLESRKTVEACSGVKKSDISSESESELNGISTPLHEAAKSGNAQKVLELLEQGLDPCIKEERGRTPYVLATDKEVRNTFRRFMASNMDKWDWHAAKVPSALTTEMEESQAAKQAEKDAKKKARSKELKKLRKAREKKAQAQATQSQNDSSTSTLALKGKSQSSGATQMSKEEELKHAQAVEREKRAAAAERRMAAAAVLNCQGLGTTAAPSSSQIKGTVTTDIKCSSCNVSLLGKVPFHRYNYKYCSTSCMHGHRESLEDG